jgi:23S rRNA (pseudouridine1915-N3)-methyltransferase
MRLSVHAVGRMKAGPERELAERYFSRLSKAGPSIGLEFSGVTEIAESRARSTDERKREEAASLAAHKGDAALIILDERGKNPSSEELAEKVAAIRDSGKKHLVFAIGGPDGHDPSSRASADYVLSFGAQTWPHQLVRVMLSEQLYRIATILSGHPYHRS